MFSWSQGIDVWLVISLRKPFGGDGTGVSNMIENRISHLLPIRRDLYRFFFLSLLAACVVLASIQSPAFAASAKSKYYTAERCELELRKNAGHQKYRDRWLRCIKKYLAVYRHNPHGPWAAAGLYNAGMMYHGLYKHSYLPSDRQEALDLLGRVVRHFPKSGYRPKADAAIARINGKAAKQVASVRKRPSAERWIEKARANDRRLEKRPKLQKYRDQWIKSITAYRNAYQADPDGQLAPAALYGLADSYAGLYRWSRSDVDRKQARKTLEDLVQQFPKSEYAQKARDDLSVMAPKSPYAATNDAISDMIRSSDGGAQRAVTDDAGAISAETAVVEGLRFWSNPRYTRVVIDANADTIFTYHELREDPSIGKPQRIYIDVHNSRLSRDLQKVVPINDNLLSDARAGQYNSDTVRVVVDIKSSKTFKIFSLKNPFRIVLDVWGDDAGAVAKAKERQPQIVGRSNGKLPASAIVKQLALGVRRIVIDPGHGGKDYGAPGYLKGVHEKKIVLQIGQRLAKKIEEQLRCEVVLTRNSDTFLSLEERTAIANTQGADLFISIHTNASPERRAYGIETFILNLATDDEAIRVAARENATSLKNISDLDSILKDLMNNAKVSESTRLATYVQQSALKSLRRKYSHIRNKGVKKAPFYVLLGAEMPSILIETSFISNPRECKRLINSHYQDLLCQGIVDGIKRYIEETNPMAFRSARMEDEQG